MPCLLLLLSLLLLLLSSQPLRATIFLFYVMLAHQYPVCNLSLGCSLPACACVRQRDRDTAWCNRLPPRRCPSCRSTNTSYDRWQAAINAWGDISTRSRDTLRQLLAYTSATPAAAAVARDTSAAPLHGAGGSGAAAASAAQTTAAAGKWLVAFSRSLKAQLTEDSDLQAELKVGL